MIPAAFPPVAPTTSLAELFGPLAPLAVLGALVTLGVLVGLLTGESWMAARRRSLARRSASAVTVPSMASPPPPGDLCA
jgi:hypothetical protein